MHVLESETDTMTKLRTKTCQEWDGNPVFFERNRVFRVYKGGKLFHTFLGDADEDGNLPEEWVASSVEALNKEKRVEREGISKVKGQSVYFDELLNRYPQEMLGHGESMGILVKYLDSAIRLPAQVHPDKAFSRQYFHSSYGKTESWIILDTREDACVYVGFRNRYTEEELKLAIEKSENDRNVLQEMMTKIPVKRGDVFLIPAGMIHAIGGGCLILEIQEPTDLTIQPEAWCGDYYLDEYERYLGLEQKDALKCFDFNLWGKTAVEAGRKVAQTFAEDEDRKSELLIGKEDTECFSIFRHQVKRTMILRDAPGIYVVTKGEGWLENGRFSRSLTQGDYFFLPYVLKEKSRIVTNKGIEIIECLPPYAETAEQIYEGGNFNE
ncbi:MAG: class I mannose-6-phosphate isomerase [Eubacteriales bacterium]|nr:class I mannose-6-phosphate isomerase [Eubacteriales bacterium]